MAKLNPVIAAYYRAAPQTENPPAVAPAEGSRIAVGATAEASYPDAGTAGKPDGIFGSLKGDNFRTPKKGSHGVAIRAGRSHALPVGFRAQTGQVWRYKGKRGRVLHMLATMPQGVTPWDCWPWHTRLGASVHVLREDGLEIVTELEGEYRHARYHLRTVGKLTIQAEIGDGEADEPGPVQ